MAEKKATEAKEELVRIKLPKDKNNKDDVFVSVNERTFLIKRGEWVEVPKCVALVIANAEEMEAERIAFEEATQK